MEMGDIYAQKLAFTQLYMYTLDFCLTVKYNCFTGTGGVVRVG